jgi:hypothetical protein
MKKEDNIGISFLGIEFKTLWLKPKIPKIETIPYPNI